MPNKRYLLINQMKKATPLKQKKKSINRLILIV